MSERVNPSDHSTAASSKPTADNIREDEAVQSPQLSAPNAPNTQNSEDAGSAESVAAQMAAAMERVRSADDSNVETEFAAMKRLRDEIVDFKDYDEDLRAIVEASDATISKRIEDKKEMAGLQKRLLDVEKKLAEGEQEAERLKALLEETKRRKAREPFCSRP